MCAWGGGRGKQNMNLKTNIHTHIQPQTQFLDNNYLGRPQIILRHINTYITCFAFIDNLQRTNTVF